MKACRQISSRYAEVFMQYSRANQEQALEQLLNVRDIVRDSVSMRKFFSAMQIQNARKREFVETVFSPSVSKDVLEFLKFLIEKRKISYLNEIAEAARFLYYRAKFALCTIISARPVSNDDADNIARALEKHFHKQIKIEYEIDKSLLGGIKIVVDNFVFDASLRRKLDDLKECLFLSPIAA